MRLWLLDDGIRVARVPALDAEGAFMAATDMVTPKYAQCWELTFERGTEEITGPRYRWHDGHARVDDIPPAAGTDLSWIDEEPDTPDKPVAPADRNRAAILVGYGMSRPMLPRFQHHHKGAEVWTLNSDRVRGATRHFQVHTWDGIKHVHNAREIMDTSDLSCQIYTAENYPFDTIRRNYLCSSVDYMLAIADLEGFGIVCMPGLDFGGARRITEMHSARYWIGVLEGKGARVRRSPMSLMFRHIRYGQVTVEELEAFDDSVTWR